MGTPLASVISTGLGVTVLGIGVAAGNVDVLEDGTADPVQAAMAERTREVSKSRTFLKVNSLQRMNTIIIFLRFSPTEKKAQNIFSRNAENGARTPG